MNWLKITFLLCCFANADIINFSGKTPTQVIVPPSWAGLNAGFNVLQGNVMPPVTNLMSLSESDETPYSHLITEDGYISKLMAVALISTNSFSSIGPLTIELRLRKANASSFQDVSLGAVATLPSGLLLEYRFNMSDLANLVTLQRFDRLTLQVRFTCETGCDDLVYVSWSFTASVLFQPLMPISGCAANSLCVVPAIGNDQSGMAGGIPFATISGALAKTQAGQMVLVSPGIYSEILTIPAGVVVAGFSVSSTIIRQIGVSTATDLITMSAGSGLQQVTLQLVGISHVQLRGIVFPSGAVVNSQIRQVNLVVDNSAAGASGTSNVFGIYASGVGWNGATFTDAHLQLVTIAVSSNGNGFKRAILVEFSSGTLLIGVVRAIANNASSTGGSGTYIGLQTNSSGSGVQAPFAVFGGSSADISQTLGTIQLGYVLLLNSHAHSKGFKTFQISNQQVWSDGSALAGGTNYYVLGSNGIQATEFLVPIVQTSLVRGMLFHATTGPTAGNSCTFTVRRNAANTILTLQATEGITDMSLQTVSVRYSPGDFVSVQVICTGLLVFPTGTSITLIWG